MVMTVVILFVALVAVFSQGFHPHTNNQDRKESTGGGGDRWLFTFGTYYLI